MTPRASLRAVKMLHTLVWAFFVGCIVAVPILGRLGRFGPAAVLMGVVVAEGVVLAVNRLRCPLTGLAEKFTADRADNFDIYLPVWVARHNKVIFGLLFLGGTLFTLARWIGWLG